MTNKTLGEARVRVEFNPGNDSLVDLLKQKTAELINLVEANRKDLLANLPSAFTSADGSPEIQKQMEEANIKADKVHEGLRLCSIAQTAYEEAAMWAVKAATSL